MFNSNRKCYGFIFIKFFGFRDWNGGLIDCFGEVEYLRLEIGF